MAHVCPHCGAAIRTTSLWCPFCRATLRGDPGVTSAVRSLVAADASSAQTNLQAAEPLAQSAPSSEPQWRLELTRKIEAYRVRHGQPEPDDGAQPRLPFPPGPQRREPISPNPAQAPRPRPVEQRKRERLNIVVNQTDFGFGSGPGPSPNHALVPVARLGRRMLAWIVDMGLLAVCWAMFLGVLASVGVRMTGKKLDLAIAVAILCLLYAQYFGLFTAFGGTTPGMRVAGLHTVSFDGAPPTPKQLLWRSFGYLVAGGAGLLGFVWALWDDDRLCWQDRVSQTYLTAMAPVFEPRLADKPTYPPQAV
jgi:uncharacterized RDD family membrane protein YckC